MLCSWAGILVSVLIFHKNSSIQQMSAHQIPPCTTHTHSGAKAKEINRIVNHKYCFHSKNVTLRMSSTAQYQPSVLLFEGMQMPLFGATL